LAFSRLVALLFQYLLYPPFCSSRSQVVDDKKKIQAENDSPSQAVQLGRIINLRPFTLDRQQSAPCEKPVELLI